MKSLPLWLFVIAHAYGGILIIVHAPSFALIGGLMMYAAGLICGIAIAHPALRSRAERSSNEQ